MKRKFLVLFFVFLLVLSLASCGGGKAADTDTGVNASDTLSGNVSDILAAVISDADAELPMTFEDLVTVENAQGMIGLTPNQFESYVSEAAVSTAAITTFAFQVALIKCNDIATVTETKEFIATGFDSSKWICVMPERSLVVESGSYILLAVGPADSVDAIVKSFTDMADGNIGSPNIFFSAS